MQFVDLKKQYDRYSREIDRQIKEVIETSSFIMGPKIAELENQLATFSGVKHGIGVSSGTDALLFCLMALNIGPGDEVITTPFTFISSAEVIQFLGATPVFVDIDPKTYNMDPAKIVDVITNNTKAIIPVSLYGQCADMVAINRIAEKYGLPVIEDACQSFGAETIEGKSCGLSLMGCTSFFPSKPLGCYGDGGMIFTDNDELAKQMRMIRVHGQSKRYVHDVIGCNGRLDAIQAAILLAKFPNFAEELFLRRQVADYYAKGLQDLHSIVLPYTADGNIHVYAQFSIQVPDRDGLMEWMQQRSIPVAVHYPVPLHLQPAFQDLGYAPGAFPISEKVAKHIISLPMHPFLEPFEQDQVLEVIRSYIRDKTE